MSEETQQQPTSQPAAAPSAKKSILETILAAGENATRETTQEAISFELQRATFDQDYRLARVFHDSGVFGDIKGKTPEQGIATAFAKIQIGRSWNMNSGDSMQFIYFDRNGCPQVRGEYVAARMKVAGYTWAIEDLRPGCRLWPKFRGEAILDEKGIPAFVEFTREDAETAGLLRSDGKSAWTGYATDMYFWKAIARLKRRYAPEVLMGAGIADLVEDQEPWNAPREASREAQERVLAEKLEQVREFDRKRAEKAAPVNAAAPEATVAKGDFFS